MSTPEARYGGLDGARVLAAFAVIGTHVGFNSGRTQLPGTFGPVLARLDIGVTVFFLLSGFLLYRPFALRSVGKGRQPSVPRFLWRRALRILPALWIFVMVSLTWITTYSVHPTDYLHYVLLIQTYDHHDYDPNLTHLWTLTVEVSFYLMIPLFAKMFAGTNGGAVRAVHRQAFGLVGLVLLALGFDVGQSKLAPPNSQALLWLPAYLDWFALGMFLALLTAIPEGTAALVRVRRTVGEWAGSLGTCWAVAALTFMISTLPVGVPYTLAPALWWQWTTQHYLFGVAAFFFLLPLVVGSAESNGRAGRVLGSSVAHGLSNMSYAIYLWHVPIMLLTQRELGLASFTGHFWTILTATVVASTAVASASWYLIERPLLRYGSSNWRGGSAQPKAATARASTQIS